MVICATVFDLGVGDLEQFLVALITRFGFGLPRFRRRRYPLAFALQRALARLVLAAFLLQSLLFLVQPRGVVALVGNAAAVIELEDPAGDVVEEVAVVGDDQDGAGVIAQVALQPGDAFGVEMVGRLVEQQQLGLLQQQPAERDAAALAAGELGDVGVVGRAVERVHGLGDLGIEVPQVLAVDDVLELRHLVGVLVGIVHRQLVVAVEQRALGADPLLHIAAHGLVGIELRLLLQVADAGALRDPALAGEVGVDAGHDAQQRRLARAVDAEHADLGIRVEGQMDVIQHLLGRRIGLGQTLHVIDELATVH